MKTYGSRGEIVKHLRKYPGSTWSSQELASIGHTSVPNIRGMLRYLKDNGWLVYTAVASDWPHRQYHTIYPPGYLEENTSGTKQVLQKERSPREHEPLEQE